MSKLDHPFMPTLYATFRDERNVYLLMDYYPAGDFSHFLKRTPSLSDDAIPFYMATIVLMLEHIHHMDFVYRDLKPENLMVGAHGYINLIDFGMAKHLGTEGRAY